MRLRYVPSKLRAARIRAMCRLRYGSRVRFGTGVVLGKHFTFSGPGRLIIGDGVWVAGLSVETFSPEAVVEVGAGSYLNWPELRAATRISIGERCVIGSALILDTDFHSLTGDRQGDDGIRVEPVSIGNNVWIGARTAITRGVTIGDDSVIALGTVVRRDVEPGVVVSTPDAVVVKRL